MTTSDNALTVNLHLRPHTTTTQNYHPPAAARQRCAPLKPHLTLSRISISLTRKPTLLSSALTGGPLARASHSAYYYSTVINALKCRAGRLSPSLTRRLSGSRVLPVFSTITATLAASRLFNPTLFFLMLKLPDSLSVSVDFRRSIPHESAFDVSCSPSQHHGTFDAYIL